MDKPVDDAEALVSAIAHLSEYADGLAVAADCERRIEAAYAPEMERWEKRYAGSPPDDALIRMVRTALDASSNAKRIGKDADALRLVLVAARTALETRNG